MTLAKLSKPLLVFLLTSLFALQPILAGPASFTADQTEYNLNTRQTVFTGNVVMHQDKNRLYADKVVTERDSKGQLNKIIAYGKPARYLIYDKSSKQITNATANTIEYYPEKKIAILLQHARIVQAASKTLEAPRIIYDMKKHEIQAKSDHKKRSELIFTPDDFNKGS